MTKAIYLTTHTLAAFDHVIEATQLHSSTNQYLMKKQVMIV